MTGAAHGVEPGDRLGGRFDIEEPIGEGAMGVVLRAHDRRSGARVAVKLLRSMRPADVERFEREIVVLRRLDHPGIVGIVDHGRTHDGRPYLVMEWVDGVTLDKRLLAGPLPLDESVALVRAVAAALQSAHGQGVVHRDLKPANLGLSGGEAARVKVLDFGVARLLDARRLTLTGHLVGTPRYMSPEQGRGAPTVDARSDVFSLGSVLFECLTGRSAYAGKGYVEVLARIVFGEPPSLRELSSVPRALAHAVERMMSRDPADRPADGGQVVALIDALGPLAVPSLRPVATGDERRLSRHERRVVSVIVVRGEPEEVRSASGAALAGGARVETLPDGTCVGVLATEELPGELAARAARCALAVVKQAPAAAVALATGLEVVAQEAAVGGAVDRAVDLPRAPEGVRLDDVTEGLLDRRFALRRDDRGALLLGERADTFEGWLVPPAGALVGRAAELRAAREACRDAADRATTLVVVGEAGAGKTRLVQELLATLGVPPERRWIARGEAARSRSPFGALAPILRRVAGVAADATPAAGRRALADHVASLDAPDIALPAFLGEIAGVPFDDEALPELHAARREPALLVRQLEWAWTRWLSLQARQGGVTLVLDDAQWMDVASLRVMGAAVQRLAAQPIRVLAAARSGQERAIFDRLPGATRIDLGPLHAHDGAALVHGLLGGDARAAIVQAIVARAGGNALYLRELAAAHAAGRGADLPASVLGIVQARLGSLPSEARRVLRAASVLGQVFPRASVAALLPGLEPARLDAALATLCRQGALLEGPAATGELAFAGPMVREAAYASLTEEDRALAHGLAAAWLTGRSGTEPQVLAAHHEHAGAADEAVGAYLEAAEHAIARDDEDAAARCAERGLACGATGPVRGALLQIQARVRFRQGALDEAVELGEQALALAAPGEVAFFRALSVLIRAEAGLGSREALDEHSALLAATPPVDDEACLAQLEELCWAVPMHLRGGDVAAADARLTLAARIVKRFDRLEPLSASRLHYAHAIRAMFDGDLGVARRSFEACCRSHGETGNRYKLAAAYGNLGLCLTQLGDYLEAVDQIGRAIPLADELGSASLRASVRINLSAAQLGAGAIDPARESAVTALSLAESLGDRHLEADARTALARVMLAARMPTQAYLQAMSAAGLCDAFPALRARALAALARAQLALGRPSEALASSGRAMAILTDGVALEEGEAEVRQVRVDALRAARRLEEAQQEDAELGARIDRWAARIEDPAAREGFRRRLGR